MRSTLGSYPYDCRLITSSLKVRVGFRRVLPSGCLVWTLVNIDVSLTCRVHQAFIRAIEFLLLVAPRSCMVTIIGESGLGLSVALVQSLVLTFKNQ